jgi:hypothetical protein
MSSGENPKDRLSSDGAEFAIELVRMSLDFICTSSVQDAVLKTSQTTTGVMVVILIAF